MMEKEVCFHETGKSRYYDLIFLDLGMPIKDGYEACELIIEYYSNKMVKTQSREDWLNDLKQVLDLYLESKNKIIQLDEI